MKTRIRAISYFLSVLAMAMVFFSVEFITEKYFYPDDETVDILAAIIGALLFTRFRRFFDRVTDRIFSRGPRDTRAEFITNISHELQTPIAILRGNVEVLQSGTATDAERISAERVIVSTLDSMSRLIGNVLESAKVKFSKKIFYEYDVAIGALLREAYEDCLLLAEDKNVRLLIEVNIDEAMEEYCSVRGNRDRLKEVLFNLISNALKHTSSGGRIILRAEQAATVVLITVEDSGCGIPPQALPHIFDRFYRMPDENGVSVMPGTGIGLNICREIIEVHKGTITAKSEPGKGSKFIISLPLSSSASSVLSAEQHAPPVSDSCSASAIINS